MKKEVKKFVIKLVYLYVGFAILGTGVAFTVNAAVGIGPWEVLNQGVSKTFHISMGTASIIVGFIIVGISLLFKMYPGIGTVLNILGIGPAIDIALALVPKFPHTIFNDYASLIFGVVLMSLGSVCYLKANLGAGPRDSFLLGIVRKFQIDTKYAKPIIEGTAILIGAILGGNIGIGTIVVLLLMGYLMDIFFKLFKINPKKESQMNFMEQINYLKELNKNEYSSA